MHANRMIKLFKKNKTTLLIAAALCVAGAFAANAQDNSQESSQHLQKEKAMKITKHNEQQATQGPEDYFTGKVMMDSPFASEKDNSYRGAMVNFEAGARTAWHKHPLGQTIIIVSGEGRAQTEGEPVQKLLPGDVVWFPANERHWHGAAPNSPMSHIAIVEEQEGIEATEWLEKVSDTDYLDEAE